jgi:biotin carboxylase
MSRKVLMKTVMVIGAATGQVPLIRKARSMAYRTVAVSCDGPYPGLNEADEAVRIDVTDQEVVLEAVRERGVEGIVTDQSDVGLPTLAYVTSQMGLPGPSSQVVRLFTQKHELREACVERGVLIPRFAEVANAADLREAAQRIGYPFILKPADAYGSRGVQVVRTDSCLERAYEASMRAAPSGLLLAEQYISGAEVAVEALVYGDAVLNLVVGTTESVNLDGLFIPCARLFPADLAPPILERVYQYNTRLYAGHGDFLALTHAEYIISDSDHEPYLIDAHIRGGGAYISSHIVPLVTNTDVYDLYVRAACGDRVELPDRIEYRQHAGYVCFLLPQGRLLDGIDMEAVGRMAGVHVANLAHLQPGLTLNAPKDKFSRFGPIIIAGESRDDLQAVRRALEDGIRLQVETPAGIRGPYWH